MGQAVVDLPDPMEKPPAGGNADDLLSQLAGDEIDRLLGEADVDHTVRVDTPPMTDAALAELTEAAALPADPSAADAGAPIDMAAMLQEAAVDAGHEMTAEMPAATPEPSGELDTNIAAHADAMLGTTNGVPSPSERDGLMAKLAGQATDEDTAPPSLPLILRPLEWLGAPLDTLNPTTRDFLGKAAIVTLVNSAAVIAYVIWFRK